MQRRVAALNLTPGDYAVFGGGPLLAHGIVGRPKDHERVRRAEGYLGGGARG